MSPRNCKSIFEVRDHLVKQGKLKNEKRERQSDTLYDDVNRLRSWFYMKDDISRMCPDHKDYVTVKTNRGKEHRQKRVPLYNISEVYDCLRKGSCSTVSLSTFASLRPPNALTIIPYNTMRTSGYYLMIYTKFFLQSQQNLRTSALACFMDQWI